MPEPSEAPRRRFLRLSPISTDSLQTSCPTGRCRVRRSPWFRTASSYSPAPMVSATSRRISGDADDAVRDLLDHQVVYGNRSGAAAARRAARLEQAGAQHMPEFRLSDPVATERVTVLDLCVIAPGCRATTGSTSRATSRPPICSASCGTSN